jgi:penicillin-binding protein 1A
MREIHMGLPARDFTKPANGIIEVTVCAKSGQLLTPQCNAGSVTLPFLEGTAPHEYCSIHSNAVANAQQTIVTMRRTAVRSNIENDPFLSSLSMPTLDPSILAPPAAGAGQPGGEAEASGEGTADAEALDAEALDAFELPDYNYFMD